MERSPSGDPTLMNEKPRKSKPNWGSMASLVIFLVFVLGRPLANTMRQWFQGTITLPSFNVLSLPWIGLLPLVAGVIALVAGALVISRILQVGNSQTPPSIGSTLSAPQYKPSMPQAPQFEPVINPLLLIVGILGLLVLGVIAILLFF